MLPGGEEGGIVVEGRGGTRWGRYAGGGILHSHSSTQSSPIVGELQVDSYFNCSFNAKLRPINTFTILLIS